MKKSLLAIAALTAFAGAAQAQSSVTVYGVLDTSMNDGSDKVTLNGGATTTVKQRSTGAGKDGLASSRIGIKGTEDLGNGLKAKFLWEQGLVSLSNGGTGSGQASTSVADVGVDTKGASAFQDAREVYVGLESAKMGEVRMGRQATAAHSVIGGFSVGGGNNVAGALYSAGGSVQNSSSSRPHDVYANRVVGYSSPKIAGAQLHLATANQAAVSETTSSAITSTSYQGIRATYNFNKFDVAIGYNQVDLNGASLDVKKEVTALGASYDFGMVKAFGLYAMSSQKLASNVKLNDQKVYELGLRAPLGKAVTVWGSMLGGSSTGTGSVAATTLAISSTAVTGDVDVSGFQLGTKYNFSKRTSAYAIYGTQARKGTGVNSASKNETTQVAFGLNHTF